MRYISLLIFCLVLTVSAKLAAMSQFRDLHRSELGATPVGELKVFHFYGPQSDQTVNKTEKKFHPILDQPFGQKNRGTTKYVRKNDL